MRAVYPFLLLAVASAPALAQNTSQNPSQPNTTERGQLSTQEQKADDRREPRVERIVVEDAGSRVDELRVGGQTVAYYSITGGSIGTWCLSPISSCSVCLPGGRVSSVSVWPLPKCRICSLAGRGASSSGSVATSTSR